MRFTTPEMKIIATSPDMSETTVEFTVPETMGHTLGNSLRRVLLSSIPGLAPLAYSLVGVEKEFTDIPGLSDNSTELALKIKNLKAVAMKETNGNEPDQMKTFVVLSINREYENEFIKFGDFQVDHTEVDTKVRILNPEENLTYVGTKRMVSIKLLLWTGVGFISYDETQDYTKTISKYLGDSAIPVDSDFSPVERVIYSVLEETPSKGFDTLRMSVITNGAIPALTAISQASGILASTFYVLGEITDVVTNPLSVAVNGIDIQDGTSPIVSPIEKYGFSKELYNKLKVEGLNTIGEAVKYYPTEVKAELMDIPAERLVDGHEWKSDIVGTVGDMMNNNSPDREQIISELESIGFTDLVQSSQSK